MTTDTSHEEIDPAELRAQLATIEAAMGIKERYEGATTIWLLAGIAFPIAALASQYVYLAELSTTYHALAWFGAVVAVAIGWRVVSEDSTATDWHREGRPNLWIQFGLVYLAAIPIQIVVNASTPAVGYREGSLLAFAIIVVLVGVAYGVMGVSLEAYWVRFRDRAVFYLGAAWMIPFGTAIPFVDLLETWPYAIYGGAYFVYAVGTYLVLLRSDGGATA